MRIVLALAIGFILVGCGGPGDTPGPAATKENKATDPAAADAAIANAPPELQARIKEAQQKAGTGQGEGPPPKK